MDFVDCNQLRTIGDEAFDKAPLEELALNEGLETIGEKRLSPALKHFLTMR